jgi:beta-phosphoglucomutase
MQRRAVIFDMDGVLIDSYRAHLESWQRLGEELGRPVTEEMFIPTFGRRNPEVFKQLWGEEFPADQIDHWDVWKEVMYRRIITEEFPGMAGAAELLDALKAAGFALAIGSSGPIENVQAALAGLNRPGIFEIIVSRDDVTHGKPHPDVFLKAAEKLGVAPWRCAVVEDSFAGLEAATKAGMTPIALVGTFKREELIPKAAQVVDSLKDLTPHIVARLIDRAAR